MEREMKAFLLASAAVLALGACTTVTDEPVAAAAEAEPAAVPVPDNILLAAWSGPYDGVPPFDRVRPDLFPEAFQFAIDERAREVRAITANPAPPTFANTVEALERAGERLDRVESTFGVMTDNMTNPEYQAIEREWQPRLAAAYD